MINNMELDEVNEDDKLIKFWVLFNNYIDELSTEATKGDEFDLDYFYSDEYRDRIEELRVRDTNPLKAILIKTENIVIGFVMYVTYFDEGGKCFLLEYYIIPEYRNKSCGSVAYSFIEKYIIGEGAIYIELTPSNERNERFWNRMGLVKTDDLDEDNKNYYRKILI